MRWPLHSFSPVLWHPPPKSSATLAHVHSSPCPWARETPKLVFPRTHARTLERMCVHASRQTARQEMGTCIVHLGSHLKGARAGHPAAARPRRLPFSPDSLWHGWPAGARCGVPEGASRGQTFFSSLHFATLAHEFDAAALPPFSQAPSNGPFPISALPIRSRSILAPKALIAPSSRVAVLSHHSLGSCHASRAIDRQPKPLRSARPVDVQNYMTIPAYARCTTVVVVVIVAQEYK